jgi:TetR/AcrR family acrAB operon transcriptional repressor
MQASKQARTQAERRGEAERRILNAAIRLIVDKGYDRFTLAEVGELAGYSRGLPAHYFGKKEDLLSEVARFIVARYRESSPETESMEPGLPRLAARIRRYAAGFGSRPGRALSVLIAEARFYPKLKRTITDLNQRSRSAWEREVRAGMAGGCMRPDLNAKAQGAIIHAFLRGQSTFVDLDPDYDAEETTEAFIEALEQRLAVGLEGAVQDGPASPRR